ncbi:TetM/TetW/TetO/TetS family tetracycline resistance ribosomal protection protein [bacterium 210820-DFI.6.37]|nr:TetM/TetW/TetO/TetS family tetracycline resistance ribosomal protection protein [bacterium 210820-DFI.6.37]
MGETSENQPMKHICTGIVAHVDAGKTTLSEAMLYTAGTIRKLGRVDHQNAFLDTDAQERARGITIFSKQAELVYKDTRIMLLDTPGHVDFSAEMERTLQVLDYAILVISGKDGVQGHTATLWKLLRQYRIPVFLFINKMDLDGTDRQRILEELKRSFDEGCVDFSDPNAAIEQIAMCDEQLLEEYLETGSVTEKGIARGISERSLFPCYFGSALKMEGVESFLEGLRRFTRERAYPKEFGARVYKITRDSQGARLTHMKITGGTLRVKELIAGTEGSGETWEEKADQIRIYSGEKYQTRERAGAGEICAVTGLTRTFAGQGLGTETGNREAVLESVLIYGIELPPQQDAHGAFLKLKQLEEEDPKLHILWNQQQKEIQIQLMGQVQLEILKTIIKQRFGIDVGFSSGQISYKETIAAPVIGAGHFEPLRHYAEVHLLLEPGPRGSGLVFDSVCSEDVLDRNWQRLILTHLEERQHPGVLTGAPITDMKITILNGRAHLKHTEGGDFRQATYRAVRQGLRKAESVLLEPWYEFRLEVPGDMVGRAMSDIQKMSGSFDTPRPAGEYSVLTGKAPVSEMKDYSTTVTSYTKGHGHLSCNVRGYEPCHNQEDVISRIGYDVDSDVENTADSVFCSHGAGFNVKWDEVEDYLHLSSGWKPEDEKTAEGSEALSAPGGSIGGSGEEDKELEQIFERTYGSARPKNGIPQKIIEAPKKQKKTQPARVLPEYLLVDGYNVIFAWEELKALAKVNLDAAREALIEILSNYQGYRKCKIIAVFDAYKVKGGKRHLEKYANIDVVYTKEAETADMYIEKVTYEMEKDYVVRVVTSDNLEQLIILGHGSFKLSAKEFKAEVEKTNAEISAFLKDYNRRSGMESRNRIRIPEKK